MKLRKLHFILLPVIATILFYCNAYIHGSRIGNSIILSLIVYAICFPIILLYVDKFKVTLERGEKIVSAVFSFIISQFLTFGASLSLTNTFSLCLGSTVSVIFYIIQSLIYFYLSYFLTTRIVYWLQNTNINDEHQQHRDQLNFKKWFIMIFGIKVLCVVFLYPCIFDFDGALGLRTYLDPVEVKSNHHPFLMQMIHGFFFNVGTFWGDASIGFAILAVLFDVISTLILLYGLYLLVEFGVKTRWVRLVGYFIAFAPFYLFISHFPTKDGFFAMFFLGYFLTLLEIIVTKTSCIRSVRFLVLHAIFALLVCLTRHQGVYIILAQSICLMMYYRKYIWRFLVAIVPVFLLLNIFNNLYLPYKDVQPGSKAEIFGTLFQQTAYCLKLYPNDVTPSEKEAISEILPIERIVEVYTPNITDPVKGCYGKVYDNPLLADSLSKDKGLMHFKKNVNIEDEGKKLMKYFAAWFTMGLRHPLTYIEAMTAVNHGYFYNKGQMLCILATDWPHSRATTPEFAFYQNKKTMDFVNTLFGYAVNIPIINWVFSIPYYIWFIILFLLLIVYRKDMQGLVLMVPLILSFAILLICPVTDARYMYPILVTLPFNLIYILKTNRYE